MNPAAAFAGQMAQRARLALAQPETRRDAFAIGGVAFGLAAPAGVEEEWLGHAFAPRRATGPTAAQPVHEIVAWDSRHEAAMPPPRPWGPTDHEPLGLVRSFSDEALRCAFDIHTLSLIVSDFRTCRTCCWFPDIAGLPAWAQASPFRIPLSWLLNRHGIQMVHGAAVATQGRAALLAGGGGAGKSTTALACALAGLGYLGDDYCAIEPGCADHAPRVHMVYRTAKILPRTLSMMPGLGDWLVNRERIGEEKGVMFLAPNQAELVRSADIAMILLPRLSGAGSTSLSPAGRADAIKALLPSTVGGLMGGTAFTPGAILSLVQAVPVYHLDLGPDPKEVAEVVATTLQACP